MSAVYKIDDVFTLEQAIRDNLPTMELEVRHNFLPGVYVRSLIIPKGTVLTGKIHNDCCVNVVAKGRIIVSIANGGHETLEAGMVFNSEPGIKRAGYALEDSVFITIHRCDYENASDITAIEKQLVSETLDEYTRRLE